MFREVLLDSPLTKWHHAMPKAHSDHEIGEELGPPRCQGSPELAPREANSSSSPEPQIMTKIISVSLEQGQSLDHSLLSESDESCGSSQTTTQEYATLHLISGAHRPFWKPIHGSLRDSLRQAKNASL